MENKNFCYVTRKPILNKRQDLTLFNAFLAMQLLYFGLTIFSSCPDIAIVSVIILCIIALVRKIVDTPLSRLMSNWGLGCYLFGIHYVLEHFSPYPYLVWDEILLFGTLLFLGFSQFDKKVHHELSFNLGSKLRESICDYDPSLYSYMTYNGQRINLSTITSAKLKGRKLAIWCKHNDKIVVTLPKALDDIEWICNTIYRYGNIASPLL